MAYTILSLQIYTQKPDEKPNYERRNTISLIEDEITEKEKVSLIVD